MGNKFITFVVVVFVVMCMCKNERRINSRTWVIYMGIKERKGERTDAKIQML